MKPASSVPVEVGAPHALELVVELDGQAAGFDDRAELAGDLGEVRVDVAVALACARPGDRLAAPDLGGVLVDDEAAAEPFRLAVAQPESVRHAGAPEPMVAHQPEGVRLVDGVGADPQEAPVQRLGEAADHLQVEGRDFVHQRRKVPGDIRRAGAIRRGDVDCCHVP